LSFILLGLFSFSSPQVIEEWVQRINGPANGSDHGHDIATDLQGNIYVTGWIEVSSGNTDYFTVKYASNGDTLWTRSYSSSPNGSDYGYALAVDQNGNVYVTGQSVHSGGIFDLVTIKYNTNGDSLWVRSWEGPTNYSSYGYSITVDNSGNVYVTGFTSDGLTSGEFITIKYDSNGVEKWARQYKGPGTSSIDYSNCVAVDDSGNVYTAGWSGGENNLHDMTTIKYNSNGDSLWVRRYNGSANDNDYAYWLDLDNEGNVYVTGQSVETGTDNDATTIKYSPGGDLLWIKHYDGPGNGYDAAQSLSVDENGNVYVTGNHTTAAGLNCMTLKYSTDGDSVWLRSFNGPGSGGDVLISIALDDSANAYVTGFVSSGGTSDFVTIKYSSEGEEEWVELYNAPANSYDGTYAITLDHLGNAYVTGYSAGIGTDWDYTTIKYSDHPVNVNEQKIIPEEFVLGQNYPNPFNPSTKIKYTIPETGYVQLIVYNVVGEEVAELVNGVREAGQYELTFNASNLPSGLYLYKLQSSSNVEVKKMMLTK
jgi:uncharacterized delta-60 repeat protein